jgi:hypothetical protein
MERFTMESNEQGKRVDPELTRQLDEAALDDRPIQAVVYLRSAAMGSPEAITSMADEVLAAAKAKAGTEPSRVNVMRNLGTVALEAPASFVRALIDEDEVESALANVQPDIDPGLGRPSDSSPSDNSPG